MRALFVSLALMALPLWAAKPNFLIIVTDDQRPDTISAPGNPRIHTPNLDRLVKNGTTFTNFLCSNPLCVPSRAEILTGCSGFRNEVLYGRRMNPELTLWPVAMTAGGYSAWYSGKWMNDGKPIPRGYHETRALFTGGGGTWQKGEVVRGRKGRVITGYRNWTFKNAEGQSELNKGTGLTPLTDKYIADGALEFLQRKNDKPFFLHVNFTGPHDPLVYPPGYEKKYTAANMKLPPNFLLRHPFDHGNFEGRDEQLLPWPRTKEDILDELTVYYAVIDHIDKQVGRIIEQLRSDGRLKNTYVIFTSDHGLALGSHGLMGKQNMYDHSVRVPFVVNGPGITADHRITVPIYLQDLMPTTLQLAGVEKPDHVDFTSIMPLLEAENAWPYKEIYGAYLNVQRSITVGEHKLIYYPSIKKRRLFNLAKDPLEMHDLADNKKHAEMLEQLTVRLAAMQEKMDDPLVRKKP